MVDFIRNDFYKYDSIGSFPLFVCNFEYVLFAFLNTVLIYLVYGYALEICHILLIHG